MAEPSSSRIKPNIRMVAERVQLSPTTVSLALRGAETIPPETRARVLAAARELGYVRTPRSARTTQGDIGRFAFVMPDFGDHPVTANPFYGEVLSGAEQACGQQDASLSFTVLPRTFATQAPLPTALHNRNLDGLLLIGPYTAELVQRIAAEVERPLVLIDNVMLGQPYDSVMADDFGGGYLATQHLLGLGHQQIVMISGMLHVPSFAERYRGYQAACRSAGVVPLDAIEVTWERVAIATILERLLAQIPAPTAFFCVHDAYAAFVIEVLRDLGRSVPDQISVVGFDNLASMHWIHPALTTIHNHPRALGQIGVQRLMARIAGDRQPSLGITVGTSLVTRASTAPLDRR